MSIFMYWWVKEGGGAVGSGYNDFLKLFFRKLDKINRVIVV